MPEKSHSPVVLVCTVHISRTIGDAALGMLRRANILLVQSEHLVWIILRLPNPAHRVTVELVLGGGEWTSFDGYNESIER